MLVTFPSPVLSVAADVVRDLDGCEALPGLWTLFTKCKGSLKDGRRLENISWRLWYRELIAASPERYGSPLDEESEKRDIEKRNQGGMAYRPPTPEEALQAVAVSGSPNPSHSRLPGNVTPTHRRRTSLKPIHPRRLSTASTRKSSAGVGRIICDLLPNSLPPKVMLHEPSRSQAAALQSRPHSMTVQDTIPSKCDLPPIPADVTCSSLPTPSTEENEQPALPHVNERPIPCQTSHDDPASTPVRLSQTQDPSCPEVPALVVQNASDPAVPVMAAPNLIHTPQASSPNNPDISLATTPVNPTGLTLPPPRLIVVNPTPNPTPHPTPPATPVLQNATPQVAGIIPPGDQHLLQPPAFHVASILHDAPDIERRSVIQGDGPAAAAALAPKRDELVASTAKAGAPRMKGEDDQVQVPPSPALTDDAIFPLQSERRALDHLDRNQLLHPLTVSTKVDVVTGKAPPNVLMLVPSSPSVVAHIFAEPCTMSVKGSPTKPVMSSPTMDVATEGLVLTSPESGKVTSPRPGPVRRQNSVGAKVTSGPKAGAKKVSRTQSTGNVPTLANTAGSNNRSGSRSREAHGPGLGLGAAALIMTRAASAAGATKSKGKIVLASKGITARLGVRKAADKIKSKPKEKDKEEEIENDMDSLKRPTFNIGSNSDEGSGMGSKSAGSGSEVLGAAAAPLVAKADQLVEQMEAPADNGISKEAENRQRAAKTQALTQEKIILGAQAALLQALLPPTQQKLVVVASDSDEEFETEEGWSSDDASGDEAEVVKSGGSNNATKPKQQQPPPPPPPPPPPQERPAAHVQVDDPVRYKHLPANPQLPPTNHIDKRHHPGRHARRQVLLNHARHTQALEQAALEAQRQREMFAKVPSENITRTRSVGLLSQLMNPDPRIFPPNHPYRAYSSGEIHGPHPAQGQVRLPGVAVTGVSRPTMPNPAQAPPPPPPAPAKRQVPEKAPNMATVAVASPSPEVKRRVSAPQPQHQYAVPCLKPSKSSAAVPLSSSVQVGSLLSNSNGETNVLEPKPGTDHPAYNPRLHDNGRPPGGYRPRARPKDAELEEESGTEEESGIQLSKSVAQEKLRALAERRGIRPNRRASTDDANIHALPTWAQQEPVPQQRQQLPTKPPPPQRTHSTPAPIPQALAHPYNLPLTALPTTPRTTRRHMLQTEMSESLRRNLLWERQVSKNSILGFRRTASSGGGARGNVLNGLRPLATHNPMPAPPNVVHLSAKGSKNNGNGDGNANQDENAAQPGDQRVFARNRSWAADEYHYAGW